MGLVGPFACTRPPGGRPGCRWSERSLVHVPTVEQTYRFVKFPARVFEQAVSLARELLDVGKDTGRLWAMKVRETKDTAWSFDDLMEFSAAYDEPILEASAWWDHSSDTGPAMVHLNYSRDFGQPHTTSIECHMPTRVQTLRLKRIFDDARESATMERPSPKVFVGHGHSPVWRELKEHLADLHDLDVEAFESRSRAGSSIAQLLNEVATEASIAFLLHTAEDETSDGELRARQNVVHETGLFQGRLGLQRAIILREEGCQPFSNIDEVQEIRFARGAVRETFGEVLAVIRREFPQGVRAEPRPPR